MIAPHSPRTFVERLDFRTTSGERTTAVITDLGVLEPRDGELTLTALHPGVDGRAGARGDGLGAARRRRARDDRAGRPSEELGALRELLARG